MEIENWKSIRLFVGTSTAPKPEPSYHVYAPFDPPPGLLARAGPLACRGTGGGALVAAVLLLYPPRLAWCRGRARVPACGTRAAGGAGAGGVPAEACRHAAGHRGGTRRRRGARRPVAQHGGGRQRPYPGAVGGAWPMHWGNSSPTCAATPPPRWPRNWSACAPPPPTSAAPRTISTTPACRARHSGTPDAPAGSCHALYGQCLSTGGQGRGIARGG